MLYTLAVVLIVLWLLGLVSSYTMGGFIHVLLVVAVVMVLVNFLSGRKRLTKKAAKKTQLNIHYEQKNHRNRHGRARTGGACLFRDQLQDARQARGFPRHSHRNHQQPFHPAYSRRHRTRWRNCPAGRTTQRGMKASDKALRENPYQAIGIDIGVGALIGYLVGCRCFRND